ncbi:MAG: hypothetical protein LBG48_01760 [Rickettsiales bacterium]|nr:hypothetical protein [Rickettsiales bacterium]
MTEPNGDLKKNTSQGSLQSQSPQPGPVLGGQQASQQTPPQPSPVSEHLPPQLKPKATPPPIKVGDGSKKKNKDDEIETQNAEMEKVLRSSISSMNESVDTSGAENLGFYKNSGEASLFLARMVEKVKDPEQQHNLWTFICECVNGNIEHDAFEGQVKAYGEMNNTNELNRDAITPEVFEKKLKECGVNEDIFYNIGDGEKSMYEYFYDSIITVRASRAKEKARILEDLSDITKEMELRNYEKNGLFAEENLSSTLSALNFFEKNQYQGDIETTFKDMEADLMIADKNMEAIRDVERALEKNNFLKESREQVRKENFKDVMGVGMAGFAAAIFPIAAIVYLIVREWHGGKEFKEIEDGVVNGTCNFFSSAASAVSKAIEVTPEKAKKMRKEAEEGNKKLADIFGLSLEKRGVDKETVNEYKKEFNKCIYIRDRYTKIRQAVEAFNKNDRIYDGKEAEEENLPKHTNKNTDDEQEYPDGDTPSNRQSPRNRVEILNDKRKRENTSNEIAR